jgi:hypothetical protein
MRKLACLVVVAVALAVGAVFGLWSSGGASAGEPNSLKCYRAESIEKKFEAGQVIYISDQFEEKEVIVRALNRFCALTEKSVAPTAAGVTDETADLTCYGIGDVRGQPRFKRQQILVEDQFGQNYYELLRSDSLCEPAIKEGGSSGIAGFNDVFLDSFEFKCYQLRRLNGVGSKDIDVTLVNQFSPKGKETDIRRVKLFCTQVFEKKAKADNDDITYPYPLSAPDEHHISTISTDRFAADDPDIKCADDYGHSVWYTFTPGASDTHSFDTYGSTYDTVMSIFAVKGESLVEVACDHDSGPDGSSHIETGFSAGTKYLIMVGAAGDGPGGKLKLGVDQVLACITACGTGSASSAAGDGEAAGPVSPQNLLCYTINERAPEDDIILAFDQLNAHLIDLGRATMFCTPALKGLAKP